MPMREVSVLFLQQSHPIHKQKEQTKHFQSQPIPRLLSSYKIYDLVLVRDRELCDGLYHVHYGTGAFPSCIGSNLPTITIYRLQRHTE